MYYIACVPLSLGARDVAIPTAKLALCNARAVATLNVTR